jgi:hypothetical protein
MDQVVVMLDGSHIHHVVGSIALPGELFPAKRFIPRFPLIRTVHAKGVGRQKGCHRHFSRPIHIEAVHGIEHPCFDGIKHLEGPHNGPGRKPFELEFAFGNFSHLFAEFLELDVSQGSRIPCGLNLPFDGCCGGVAQEGRETCCGCGDTCGSCRCFQKPTT